MINSSINPNIERIALRLKTLPDTPGVYQYLDEAEKVIYVGKARNLRRRVTSYFQRYDDHSPKIKMLVRNIFDLRITVTPSEVDALLLENNLIKQLMPKYNSMLKDDKTYPYIGITDEDYPRIIYTRRRDNMPGQYFGPYPNPRILHELMDVIRHLFSYRACNTRFTEENLLHNPQRPCMSHQIGLCCAPCCGETSREDYLKEIEKVRKVLKGDFGETLDEMKKDMFAHADALDFEKAEKLRRRIHLLEEYQSRSTIVNTNVHDVDVYSIVSDEHTAYVNIMRIKRGSVIYSFSTSIKKQLDESDTDILAMAIPQLHERTESTAQEVVVPFLVEDLPSEYIAQNVPTRGDRLHLLELSTRNVKSYQHQILQQKLLVDPDANSRHLLERIQKELHLKELPVNIECFDNSNIQGNYPVAAMVRFTNGKPDRAEYRKFNIKTVEGPDDYASMAEVIYRRYKRLSEEGKELPQLLVVDGGEGQMKVAHEVLTNQLHLDIPIAGLAKDEKHRTHELLYGYPPRTIGLKPTDPLFHLLERMQNEVHRFAVSFHRAKRSKGTFRTQLTDIPSIGEKTAQALLLRFGSVKEVKVQPFESLAAVIGAAKAKKVVEFFDTGTL
ncbi:MAG: excinuclease ABC subunit UvrC [Bacteroidales bacterium]|nr:excinuclease ABC subunit UvrC [Bacteroidales bacterium]